MLIHIVLITEALWYILRFSVIILINYILAIAHFPSDKH